MESVGTESEGQPPHSRIKEELTSRCPHPGPDATSPLETHPQLGLELAIDPVGDSLCTALISKPLS